LDQSFPPPRQAACQGTHTHTRTHTTIL